MTTGSQGNLPYPIGVFGQTGRQRSWQGLDGKYEVDPTSGNRRTKWNNFRSDAWDFQGSGDYFSFIIHDNFEIVKDDFEVRAYGSFVIYPVGDDKYRLPASYQQELLSRISEKFRGHDFNLGVETGQARQTVSLLTSNLQKLGRSALALRRGDFSTAARSLGARPRSTRLKSKDISGRWLELQYGWLPLLSSSYEAAKAFEAISRGPRKSRVSKSIQVTQPFDASSSLSFIARCQCQVGMKMTYEYSEELSVQRQLGLLDPLSVAWELTPWSFVVDWFLPIGSYLSNLAIIPHLKGRWMVEERFKIGGASVQGNWTDYSGFPPPRWRVKAAAKPRGLIKSTRYIRTCSSIPPPVPLPRFNQSGLTLKRFYNAVALAHQRFTK